MVDFGKRILTYWRGLNQRVFRLKFWILLGILWIIEDGLTRKIVEFSKMTGEKTTPAVYVFIQSTPIFFTIFLLVVICFFSEAPFTGREQLYVILREGKKRWYFRQLCYLFYGATIVMAAAVLICQMQMLSCLKLSEDWDKILGTLALTSAGVEYRIPVAISYRIIAHYTPQEAFFHTILIGWGVTLFLGVFMFAVSLCFTRKAALLTATAMVIMCSLHRYYPAWMHYASPVSWISTVTLGLKYMDHAPGLSYVRVALPAAIGLCVVVGWIVIQKTDLDWTEE